MRKIHICNYCKKPFEIPYNRYNKKNCSRECYEGYLSTIRTVVKCDNCGIDFKRNPYRLNRNPKHQFCSRICWRDFLDKKRTGNQIAACASCNKIITGIPFQRIERNENHYCSRYCLYIANRSQVTVSCEYCGNQIERSPSDVMYNKHTFCDITCRSNWRKIYFIRDKHPGWKGGCKTKRDYGPSWRKARKLALARDNHECQHCGALKSDNGRNLDIHHIKPFVLFGYVRNVNNNDEIANNVDNLITLCRRCHWNAEPFRRKKSPSASNPM